MVFKPLPPALANRPNTVFSREERAACGQDEDLQGIPPACAQGCLSLLCSPGQWGARLPGSPAAASGASAVAARADYFFCAALKGAAGSHLLTDKAELKIKAKPAWCSPQEAGLAGSTGLSSATQPGAELHRHPLNLFLQNSCIWKWGLKCSMLPVFAVLCMLAPSLQTAAQAFCQLQDAGEGLEVTNQSSSRQMLHCPALLPHLDVIILRPGDHRCSTQLLVVCAQGTAHAGTSVELFLWVGVKAAAQQEQS